MSFELFPYQTQCIERASVENSIVSLPTGKGKTLVAVRVIDCFLHQDVDKHVVFVVPTKALVSQQADYCTQHCKDKPNVAQLSGMEMESWDELKWRLCLKKSKILVGTPEVFRRAMDKGFLNPGLLSLVVFDECHHATGNSPMARIMLDFISKLDDEQRPRILGLTASFFTGNLKRKRDAEKSKIELELLLKARVFSPKLPDDDAIVLDAQKKWTRISWDAGNHAENFHAEVMQPLSIVFEELGDVASMKDLNKMAVRMNHVFTELGKAALRIYITTCIVRQLKRQMEELLCAQELAPEDRKAAQGLVEKLPVLQKLLEGLDSDLPKLKCVDSAPELSAKVVVLHELLKREALAAGKGIIFVEQVALTLPLAHITNKHVQRQTEAIYGQMSKVDTNAIIKGFKTGQTRILVSTTALEEGIDVCDCDWVVRFDKFNTSKSHIQGSGRARSNAAHIYYFDNDPEEELSKAVMLSSIAKDTTVSLTDDERKIMEEARLPDLAAAKGVYPYDEPGGQEVHLFNCLEIVYEWCQQVMGSSFKADSIFSYANGKLQAINFPTSAGMRSISHTEIDELWGDISLQQVIQRERLQTLSKADQVKRRGLFVVAVALRRDGMLSSKNEAVQKSLMFAKVKCAPAEPPPMRLSITGSFGRSAVQVKQGNYKTVLQELLQPRYRSLTMTNILKYDAVLTEEGWMSTARVLPVGQSFPSEKFASKKAAEQDAAKKAFEALSSE